MRIKTYKPLRIMPRHYSRLNNKSSWQYNGRIKGLAKGCPSFLVKFCIIFEELVININSIYIAGKRSGHPYLNFLNPSLLIVGFHMTSLKFKLKNYRSYRDFTFTIHQSSWKLIFIQIFPSKWVLGFCDAAFTWWPRKLSCM